MKKMLFVLVGFFVLSGCILPREIDENTILGDAGLKTESRIPYAEEKEEKVPEKNPDAAENKEPESASYSDEAKADVMRKQQDLFYYAQLDVTEQNVYAEILYALEHYAEEMELSTLDIEVVDKVFQYVLLDHPEIFYADGYSFIKYTLGEEVKKITFKGTYIYDAAQKEEREALIEEKALTMLRDIPADASDYEKVKYVYETVIKNTEYDLSSEDNQNICSVFLNGRSVCQGYAKAVQYLLTKLKVPATVVLGTVENGEGHAWNLVKIDNQYYYVDATWGDASYLFQENEGEMEYYDAPAINYDYLCVTTEELLRTHTLGDIVNLPFCDSMSANYYVREGAYFTELDYNQLETLIQRYQKQQKENVTLRCRDESVYETMVEELIQKQTIFHYIDGTDDSILYVDSPKQLSITFWL